MPEKITLKINGQMIQVDPTCTVAGAMAQAGVPFTRRSVTGEPRTPLCGMGICFECRVTINGQPQTKSCQLVCQEGWEVWSDDTH